MYEDSNRELCALSAIILGTYLVGYAIGHKKGRKKGEGMLKVANQLCENNAKSVDKINEKIKEINGALERINQWKAEHSDEFGYFD